jgi:integrase
VSVLAYAGLRPGEALALRWEHIRERTILVEGSVSLGREKDTKTHRTRTVRLLGPLGQDMAEWRLASGRPDESALIFPALAWRPWADHDYRNWRKRIFRPTALAAGVEAPRPYDLRHSFVSLLIHEGVSIVEVARQAGHSPEECLKTYAHTFEEFDPADRKAAAATIGEARRTAGVPMYAFVRAYRRNRGRRAWIWLWNRKPTEGFEPSTPAYEGDSGE